MRYCKKCVQPDTRPNIYFDDNGICGACLWEEEKKHIDWQQREAEALEIAAWAKSQKAVYDCVVGVSGGKDSTFQALYARDVLGLRPLLVCSEPCENTQEGEANLKNIKSLGFDSITLKANSHILRALLRKDFFSILNPNRASEYCLHSSVYIIADKFDIPLVINGENAGQTLGVETLKAAKGDATQIFLSDTLTAHPTDLYATDNVSYEELFMYRVDMNKINKKGIKGIWCSNYIKDWGQVHNARFSLRQGLTIRPLSMDPYACGYYRRYFALDHSFRSVNQLLKYIKFGFGFATDQACYDIRDNEISRQEGVFLVKELDGACSSENISNFCHLIDIDPNIFWDHANTFRGDMWQFDERKRWRLIKPIWEQELLDLPCTVASIMQRLAI